MRPECASEACESSRPYAGENYRSNSWSRHKRIPISKSASLSPRCSTAMPRQAQKIARRRAGKRKLEGTLVTRVRPWGY